MIIIDLRRNRLLCPGNMLYVGLDLIKNPYLHFFYVDHDTLSWSTFLPPAYYRLVEIDSRLAHYDINFQKSLKSVLFELKL